MLSCGIYLIYYYLIYFNQDEMIKTCNQINDNKQKLVLDLLNELKLWSNSPSNKSILQLIAFENDLNENLYDIINKLNNKLTISIMKNDSVLQNETNELLNK